MDQTGLILSQIKTSGVIQTTEEAEVYLLQKPSFERQESCVPMPPPNTLPSCYTLELYSQALPIFEAKHRKSE